MLKKLFSACILCFLLLLPVSSAASVFVDANSDDMIVRLCPPPGREWVMKPDSTLVLACTGYTFREMMDNPNDWTVTRSAIDYFGYPSWILYDRFTDAELTGYFSQFLSWGINFDLGVIAIKDLPYAHTGEQCYTIASTRWNRFDNLGADITSLTIDEPYTATVVDL